MGKTVCSVHKIAYEIGALCSYCEGVKEEMLKTVPSEPEEPVETGLDLAELDSPVSWQSVDQLLNQFVDDDDDDPMNATGYNFPWV